MNQPLNGSAAATEADAAKWADTPDYPHCIENHVKVYLHLEETAAGSHWAVSGVTVDGYPLDGTENGNYCDYEGHPLGARPDWDRQHQAAEDLDLPTAAELLPLLTDALGTRVDDPTGDQLRAASDLIAEHADWRADRADLSAGESAGDVAGASDWHASDDAGCDLADRAIALLAVLTGQGLPGTALGPEPTDVAMVQSQLEAVNASDDRLRHRPDPPTMEETRPAAGPTR